MKLQYSILRLKKVIEISIINLFFAEDDFMLNKKYSLTFELFLYRGGNSLVDTIGRMVKETRLIGLKKFSSRHQ